MGEGDNEDGGEDGQPHQVGGGQDEGRDDGEDSLEVKTTDLSSYVKVNEVMILIKSSSWDENTEFVNYKLKNTDFSNSKHFKGND